MDTNDSSSVLLLYILRIQHTILWFKSINSAQFCPKPYQNEYASLFIEVNGKSLVIGILAFIDDIYYIYRRVLIDIFFSHVHQSWASMVRCLAR